MVELTVNRFYQNDRATIGKLSVGDKTLFTLELPWENNERNKSCIPIGRYPFFPHGWEKNSQTKYKMVWGLDMIKDRSGILMHIGNYTSNTEGCLLIGEGVIIDGNNIMVTNSRNAINYMRQIIGENGGYINIKD